MQSYIDKIIDPNIKNNVEIAYKSLPESFFKGPASSSGKYHPSFSLGEGGLIRHVKFACDIAISLFEITNFNSVEKDIILASLILHDGLKYGFENCEHTIKEHDDLMADYLKKIWIDNQEILIDQTSNKIIIGCIRSHMGKWATTKYPSIKIEIFVHWCDYLASRKFVDNYYGAKS